MSEWWRTFFDADYLRLWEGTEPPEKTEREVTGLWQLLEPRVGSRVLDAPCGYGRVALRLAQRGAVVLGIDFSADLLAEAERRRGGVPPARLRYQQRDLRTRIPESDFDVAINVFSSLSYGSEADDLATLSTLRTALRPGGRAFIETMHRDRLAVVLSQTERHGNRLSDGTLSLEEPRFDAIAGRVESTWYWSGPRGNGQKRSSLRVYAATELAALISRAGLRVLSAHSGCTPEPFRPAGPSMSARLRLLGVRD
ncbi:MAG: class I SAM-dependent methyltransferase [Steroidobacteraceae bacterium]